jgi:hypothetical protein
MFERSGKPKAHQRGWFMISKWLSGQMKFSNSDRKSIERRQGLHEQLNISQINEPPQIGDLPLGGPHCQNSSDSRIF